MTHLQLSRAWPILRSVALGSSSARLRLTHPPLCQSSHRQLGRAWPILPLGRAWPILRSWLILRSVHPHILRSVALGPSPIGRAWPILSSVALGLSSSSARTRLAHPPLGPSSHPPRSRSRLTHLFDPSSHRQLGRVWPILSLVALGPSSARSRLAHPPLGRAWPILRWSILTSSAWSRLAHPQLDRTWPILTVALGPSFSWQRLAYLSSARSRLPVVHPPLGRA